MILPVKLRFRDNESVVIRRFLVAPGKILVRVGDTVSAADRLGIAEVSDGKRDIDLAHLFSLKPSQVLAGLLKKPGETVYRGEPIFRTKKLFGLGEKTYESPADGTISEVSNGVIVIHFVPSEISLNAGFSGLVHSIKEGESVDIQSTTASFRGAFGYGGLKFGEIKIISRSEDFLFPQDVTADCVGKIVVGGALVTGDTLEKAAAIGVLGIVAGGVHFHDTRKWTSEKKPDTGLLILEGYGFHHIDPHLWKELSNYDGKYAALSGDNGSLFIATGGRPDEVEVPSWKELQIGDRVRIVAGSGLGENGIVEKIDTNLTVLESKIAAALVTFKQGSEKVIIPWQNLEIIEIGPK